jgi:hypothetical protein
MSIPQDSQAEQKTIKKQRPVYETHLTIAAPDPSRVDALEEWAGKRSFKFGHILLDRGKSPSQPMLTRGGRGTIDVERDIAEASVRDLRADGFDVVRVKIEAAPSNEDVPKTDAEASDLPESKYFEHHVKVLLADEDAVAGLTSLAVPHGGHVSRNARRVRPDGRQERFVTQRLYRVGRETAKQHLDSLLNALNSYEVLEIEEEFVVYDDNVTVDAGWFKNDKTTELVGYQP